MLGWLCWHLNQYWGGYPLSHIDVCTHKPQFSQMRVERWNQHYRNHWFGMCVCAHMSTHCRSLRHYLSRTIEMKVEQIELHVCEETENRFFCWKRGLQNGNLKIINSQKTENYSDYIRHCHWQCLCTYTHARTHICLMKHIHTSQNYWCKNGENKRKC